MSEFRRKLVMANNRLPYDTIMTSTSNPQVLSVCYAQGWCASPKYMTATEAAAVTSVGTVFQNNTTITHFEEFEYFIGLTSIAERAFQSCSNLLIISIPDNVSTIGLRAFYLCKKLNYLVIGRSVITIGDYCCSGCDKLTKIKFNGKPSALNNNGGLVSAYMYYIKEFESDDYTVIDGILYNENTLLAYPANKSGASFTVPSFVTSIYPRAFQSAAILQNLIVNEGCTSLGASALRSSVLRTLDLPSTLTSIGIRCIYQMNYLYSLTSRAITAPNVSAEFALQNLGSSATQTKILYVPSGATGYNTGKWATLINSGWTLEEL